MEEDGGEQKEVGIKPYSWLVDDTESFSRHPPEAASAGPSPSWSEMGPLPLAHDATFTSQA